MKIQGHSPEDYAAMWGCDPAYDKEPRKRGDGYLFYNYGGDPMFQKFPKSLLDFIGAIDRTLKTAAGKDQKGLMKLRQYVQKQLQALGIIISSTPS
jgi:hypothetical protein